MRQWLLPLAVYVPVRSRLPPHRRHRRRPRLLRPRAPRAGTSRWAGNVPLDISGVYYNKGLTILLIIVTCGIWGIFWTYRTQEDLKKYNGDGLGGVLGIVIYLLLSVVLMFTIPNEVKNMYERDGRARVSHLGLVVPAADHRAHHLVPEGAERAERLLAVEGRGADTALPATVVHHRRVTVTGLSTLPP